MTLAEVPAETIAQRLAASVWLALRDARATQTTWAYRSPEERCRLIGQVAGQIAMRADWLCRRVALPQRQSDAETISAELIPLADACRWLSRHGAGILKEHRATGGWCPLWMWGTRTKIARRPHGVVFVIGAFNYPLFLPGVQILQALAAGNAVLFKPAPGAEACGAALVDLIRDAGIPKGLLQCLPVDSEFARQTIREGVELVVLTGSSKTGRAVLREAAERLTPVVAELSGCDAMFIFNGADLDLVRSAINFGLTFNSSATCIAPRRMIVEAAILPDVIARLQSEPAGPRPTLAVHRGAIEQVIGLVADAVRRGGQVWPEDQWNPDRLCESGRMSPILILGCQPQWPIAQADLFAPLLSVIACPDRAAMLAADQHCPYALGASIFGPREEAGQFARQLGAGAVTINDLIVPTADPRVPFGGSGESGFGVTRGPEGLLAMTRPQAIMDRKHGPRFHLQPPSEDDAKLLDGMLRFQHAPSWRERWRGLRTVIQVSRQRPKQP